MPCSTGIIEYILGEKASNRIDYFWSLGSYWSSWTPEAARLASENHYQDVLFCPAELVWDGIVSIRNFVVGASHFGKWYIFVLLNFNYLCFLTQRAASALLDRASLSSRMDSVCLKLGTSSIVSSYNSVLASSGSQFYPYIWKIKNNFPKNNCLST